MSRMTEQQGVWKAWMDAFGCIQNAAPDEVSVDCPSCGDGKVKISYTGDPQSRIGYAILWCDACLRGIHLSRVGIPEGVDMLTFDSTDEEHDAAVPDVHLLAPDPWIEDEDDAPLGE
ncbi:hypothetical protein HC028_15225 [Planosporangium flavigriseum]|uniref:Uncharacterized protein n=1 Tax=Planosporangium flavigriseum TaxID=373681 RepID=A0A8J3PPP0_9ACTN|nr:hypothetical protein [Planosporangium flavigriseum]NJC65843.1 hypothetical protein [Planosporangium flavigriseum]GIG76113.1 hypothetical protein Pfl04_45170 [Planosporangium flavigriseum]